MKMPKMVLLAFFLIVMISVVSVSEATVLSSITTITLTTMKSNSQTQTSTRTYYGAKIDVPNVVIKIIQQNNYSKTFSIGLYEFYYATTSGNIRYFLTIAVQGGAVTLT